MTFVGRVESSSMYIIGKLSPPDVSDTEVHATSAPLPILIVKIGASGTNAAPRQLGSAKTAFAAEKKCASYVS